MDDTESRDPTYKLGAVAAGIVLAIALVIAGILALSSDSSPTAVPRGKASAWRPGEAPPEAAAILKWLAENSNDPKSVEVVAWENRQDNTIAKGMCVVTLKYRSRNDVGAVTIKRRAFYLRGGTVTDVLED